MVWLIVAIAIAAFLFWVSRKPDTFRIERTTSINASAKEVYGRINNVHRFNEWNPWMQMDPQSVVTYSGPDEGPGASYAWVGKKTGQGSMTLKDEKPYSEINFALDFLKPMKANNVASFRLNEGNGTTIVIWAMTGANGFTNKLFQTFFNMDKIVGRDFEKGLARLKELVETKKLA